MAGLVASAVTATQDVCRCSAGRLWRESTGRESIRRVPMLRELLRRTVDDYQRRAHLGRFDSWPTPGPRWTARPSVTGRGPLVELLGPSAKSLRRGDKITYLEAGGTLRSGFPSPRKRTVR